MDVEQFENWWSTIINQGKFENGNIIVGLLEKEIINYAPEVRFKIINWLFENNHIDFAYSLIQFGNKDQKKLVRIKFKEWLDKDSNDYLGNDLLYAILKTYEISDYDLVRRYLTTKYNTIYFSVPIGVFYIDSNLFLSSMEVFLSGIEDRILYSSEAISYLILDVAVLKWLISNLSERQAFRLKKFCSKRSSKPFYSDEIKNELTKLSKL